MPDITLTLNLDQPTLAYRRVRSITERLIVAMDALTGGATYTIKIRPILAGAVAAELIAAGRSRLVLKVPGPIGDVELARLNTAAFDVISEGSPAADVGWSGELALTSAQLRAFFADGAQQKFATLEITHVGADNVLYPLYLVNFALLAGYLTDAEAVSASEDLDNTKLKIMGTVTSTAEMRALTTTGYGKPKVFHFLINDNWKPFTLRTKAVSGEDDDDETFIQPTDYNASTNNVIFVHSPLA